MQPLQITSSANPRVKALARLQDQKGRRETGLFIAEGARACERALAAGLPVVEAWLCPALLKTDQARQMAAQLAAAAESVVEASAEAFRKACYVDDPEGLLAVCEPPAFTREGALDAWGPGKDALILVAVGTEKPGNLGAMVRSADAAGCAALIAAGAPVDALNPNAIRSSTGAVFCVPTFGASEEDAIAWLKQAGFRILATYPQGLPGFAPMNHAKAKYGGKVALVVGPEDRGLSEAWAQAAKDSGGACIAIPMQGQVTDSLNASVAAGIVLFEAARQRATA